MLEDNPSVKLAACHYLVDEVLEVLQVQQLVYVLINEDGTIDTLVKFVNLDVNCRKVQEHQNPTIMPCGVCM